MVVFGLRTTLMAINPRIPYSAVWGRSDESLSRNGTLAEFCGDGAMLEVHVSPPFLDPATNPRLPT